MTDDAQAIAAPLTETFGGGPDQLLASPIVLVGTVDEIVARLHERRERWGYSYFTIQQPVAREFAAVVDRLAGSAKRPARAAVSGPAGYLGAGRIRPVSQTAAAWRSRRARRRRVPRLVWALPHRPQPPSGASVRRTQVRCLSLRRLRRRR